MGGHSPLHPWKDMAMTFSAFMHRAGIAAALVALPTGPAAAAPLPLEPGQWTVTNQVWIDGKEVLGQLDAVSRQVMSDVRARMTPQERAELDRNLPPAQSAGTDTECITAQDAGTDGAELLRGSLQSIHEPPWQCTFSRERADRTGFAFDYRCSTTAGGRAEGRAQLTAAARHWRTEINGRGNWVLSESGAPLDLRVVPVRAVSEGRWQAPRCEP
jgi:hypothetical protein